MSVLFASTFYDIEIYLFSLLQQLHHKLSLNSNLFTEQKSLLVVLIYILLAVIISVKEVNYITFNI